MPSFSVVIPCYNCASSLPATLASVKAQTVTDWEVILVDDGSTDATPAVLAEEAKADERIRVVQLENGGPARARNHGARVANADVIAFLDSDDLWFPKKLESVDQCMKAHRNADAVFGRIAFFRENDGIDATTSTVKPGWLSLGACLGENPACTVSNLTVSRKAFLGTGGFAEDMRHAEDLEWMIRAILSGLSIAGTAELHVRYRASDGGLSSDLREMHAGWRRAVFTAQHEVSRADLKRAEAVHLRYLARRALRIAAPSSTALHFAKAGMRANPIAFLGGAHRGPATLLGCLAAPILPEFIRHRAFA